jgi:GT2 family glycosyltransferase
MMSLLNTKVSQAPRVSVIILNWNGWKDTIECLESLYQISYPNYDVIVIDNGSTDDSIEKIKEFCEGKIIVNSSFFKYSQENKPIKIVEYTREEAEAGGGKESELFGLPSNKRLILIRNEKNYGFAGGNNVGIRYALKALNPDYLLLLNNDTVVDREFLSELVKVGEREEKIGAVNPKIYRYDEPKRLQAVYSKVNFSGGRAPVIGQNKIDNGQFDLERETGYVFGECFFVKSKVIRDVGLFNPNYFCYWEEIELCMRIRKKGYRMLYCPKARIWHKVSRSSGRIIGFKEYHSIRNCIWTVRKHANLLQKLTFVFYFPLVLAWTAVNNPSPKILKAMIKGVKDGVFSYAASEMPRLKFCKPSN